MNIFQIKKKRNSFVALSTSNSVLCVLYSILNCSIKAPGKNQMISNVGLVAVAVFFYQTYSGLRFSYQNRIRERP